MEEQADWVAVCSEEGETIRIRPVGALETGDGSSLERSAGCCW